MTATSCHDWKQLAEAARNEKDSEKLMNLIDQLNRALEEHAKCLHPRSTQTAA